MRVVLSLVIIFIFVFAGDDSFAEVTPGLVRIRMHKELDEFPVISGSQINKINENFWSVRGENLTFLDKKLANNNYIIRKSDGRFDIISILEFNEYLAGVVAHEMPLAWPLEALKAQAVVARSYALARIFERRNKLFHLESDQNDQVFSMTNSQKTRSAVYETDGIILKGSNGKVLKAFFHSDCGGQTVTASSVWGAGAVDSGTARDPWCAEKKSNIWSFEMGKTEFLERLELADMGQQTSYFSHKAQMISIGPTEFSVQKLREIFGFFRIRSAVDTVEISDEKVKIGGQGFGHGAGLCQWGTLAQVRQGKSYIKVLEHYYPKAKLAKNSLRLSLHQQGNFTQNTVSN